MLTVKKNLPFIDTKDIVINILDHKVKITHIPTGTVIESSQHNSHFKNKFDALASLRKLLSDKLAS